MRKKKILIADDDPKFVASLIPILKKNKYKVIVANNGEEALSKTKSHKPDLILLDIRMPQLDGFLVCEELKKSIDTCNIPIIFLTALSDRETVEKARGLGSRFFLSKPIGIYEVETLLELVEKALEEKK